MQTRKSFLNPIVLISLGCVLAFAAACGDDDDSSNPTPGGGTKATGGKTGAGGESTTPTAGKAATGGKGSGGTTAVGTGGAGGEGATTTNTGGVGGEQSCTDDTDMGCYRCAPSTLVQYLNACPSTGCEPFDNTKLTSIKNGKLPALP